MIILEPSGRIRPIGSQRPEPQDRCFTVQRDGKCYETVNRGGTQIRVRDPDLIKRLVAAAETERAARIERARAQPRSDPKDRLALAAVLTALYPH